VDVDSDKLDEYGRTAASPGNHDAGGRDTLDVAVRFAEAHFAAEAHAAEAHFAEAHFAAEASAPDQVASETDMRQVEEEGAEVELLETPVSLGIEDTQMTAGSVGCWVSMAVDTHSVSVA
jgi:hypothetical protein